MPLKKTLTMWVQKFISGLLIFCIGGVGSLTYFDGFLPGHEHDQHPYHLSILGEPAHSHHPLSLPSEPETLAHQMSLRWASRFGTGADFILAQHQLAPGLAQFFADGLNDGYLLATSPPKIFDDTSLSSSILAAILSGRSVYLPSPDKPPQLSS